MLSASPRCDSAFRVSSVLNRNTRQFGKKHLFDQDEETCWNSDQVRHPLPGLSIPGVNQNQGGKSKRFPVRPVVETDFPAERMGSTPDFGTKILQAVLHRRKNE